MGDLMRIEDAVKAINSEWDVGIMADSADIMGNKYKTYYIIGQATDADYKAVADYMGFKYRCGYLYEKYILEDAIQRLESEGYVVEKI